MKIFSNRIAGSVLSASLIAPMIFVSSLAYASTTPSRTPAPAKTHSSFSHNQMFNGNFLMLPGVVTAIDGTDVTVTVDKMGNATKKSQKSNTNINSGFDRSTLSGKSVVIHASGITVRSATPTSGISNKKNTPHAPGSNSATTDLSALAVGSHIIVMGEMGTDGTMTAKQVHIIPTFTPHTSKAKTTKSKIK